ncbi:pimeloyl-CoA dehydrogenase, small subunit [Rhizobiales bacterium GAS191]|jgi:pimeloyl-CoA dehydrogenase small subunit|nr:pimeloyl-CoA dehydrogenase, small subunit [Rhizobiales bacterium GAS113]SEC39643.1 pimeloyl-CoA dehydrogenase, small subunit [Rhizobiales bacterium GAS188]SEC87762.1 pimeloyl-CoA dehydrogenase, small subunit [Rhizobiales bacterium GAS191]
MDFDLTDEQKLLRDNVERLAAPAETAVPAAGWSRERWKQFAELGLLALPFSEEDGGLGWGAVETMIVMEAFGKGLVREPYLSTVVIGGGLVRHGCDASTRKELAAQIASGELVAAFAHTEREARYGLADVGVSARKSADGFVLDGVKSVVPHGDQADMLFVSARNAGGRHDREGLSLLRVDAKAKGVTRRAYALADGTPGAEIRLDNVTVPASALVGAAGEAAPLIERVADEAIAALCAEAVGVMDAMCDMTVAYLKTRKQFGRPIGAFQALQHRAADMFIALEQSRSMAVYATMMVGESDPAQRSTATSAAKVTIGKNGRFIGEQAVQLHGGMGMTMEYRLGAYFKRMTAIEMMFGDVDHHLRKVAQAGGLEQAVA